MFQIYPSTQSIGKDVLFINAWFLFNELDNEMQYADKGELKKGKRPGPQNRTHVLPTTYDLKHSSKEKAGTTAAYCVIIIIITLLS